MNGSLNDTPPIPDHSSEPSTLDSYRPHFFDLIVGGPGSGKTWLLMHLSNLYQERGWQVIYLSMADDRLPANPNVIEAETLNDAIDKAHEFPNVVLSIDELSSEIPGGNAPPDERVLKIARLRRHVRMSILGTSQCPWDIHVRVRKLFNRLYYFEMDLEGQQWLKRQGVKPADLAPPAGTYGMFDKGQREVTFTRYKINSLDWR